MLKKNYLITNIAKLIGILPNTLSCLKGKEMGNIETIDNAFVLVENGIIAEFGQMQNCTNYNGETIDATNQWVLPGFIDSHTHMVFAAPRHNEYVMRLQGKTYEEIAAEGGGILNSAEKIQAISEVNLYKNAFEYAQKAIACGTCAIEIKSGYGLTVDAEIKMLRVIKCLKENLPITIKATFLGAHAMPIEFKNNRKGYLDLIVNQMLPIIAKENLADFMDVFCDNGFYTVEETDYLLKEAAKYGMIAKIHGNELGLTGGVQVAVANNALSVDHLEHISEQEIDCLLHSQTMPVVLPGSSFFLKIPYSPARQMIDAGLPIAIASDFNPGSSPHYNLWFTMSLACLYNKMLPIEALNAVTINAAYALGISQTHGSITIGKKACLQFTRAFESINEMPYWFTQNHTEKIIL